MYVHCSNKVRKSQNEHLFSKLCLTFWRFTTCIMWWLTFKKMPISIIEDNLNSRLTYLNTTVSYCNCYKTIKSWWFFLTMIITDNISNQSDAFFHQLSHQSISEIKERTSIAPSVVIFCINWMMKEHIPLIRNKLEDFQALQA